MKALIAQLKQESNTFNKRIESAPAVIHFGRDAELALLSTHNELNGFMNAVSRNSGIDVTMSVCAECKSGGILSDDIMRSVLNSIKSDIISVRPQLILIALNGATVTECEEDGCGEFLDSIRACAGDDCVIGVTVDMHANLTERMVKAADIIMSYKTSPHTDLYETGKKTAELSILAAQERIKLHCAMVKLPLIIPVEMGATDNFPARGIVKKAAGIENRQGVYCTSVTFVEPWLNVSDMGCAVAVYADNASLAEKYAYELTSYIWDMRHNTVPEIKSIQESIRLARRPKELPVLFVDSADSPAAGAYGDSAVVIDGLLQHADGLKCIANVTDPAAARLACIKGEGSEIETELGGWSGTPGIAPVHFKGRVARICKSMFTFKGTVMNGRTINMGMTALLEHEGIYVLVTENTVDNRDPEMYRSAGIVIEDMDIVCVKSAAGYTVSYSGLYTERIILDTPGLARPVFEHKDYDKLKKSVYPIDKDACFIQSENTYIK